MTTKADSPDEKIIYQGFILTVNGFLNFFSKFLSPPFVAISYTAAQAAG